MSGAPEQPVELGETGGQLVELAAERRFHAMRLSGRGFELAQIDRRSDARSGACAPMRNDALKRVVAKASEPVDALERGDQLRAFRFAGGVERRRAAHAAACCVRPRASASSTWSGAPPAPASGAHARAPPRARRRDGRTARRSSARWSGPRASAGNARSGRRSSARPATTASRRIDRLSFTMTASSSIE